MSDKTIKKVTRKHVQILEAELTQKRTDESKYNKLQKWIAKVFKLELSDQFQCLYRIRYKGNAKLNVNDVVVNSDGVMFGVAMESNRLAMIATIDSVMEKPKVYGKLTILEKPKK